MTAITYLMDTQSVVWFTKGLYSKMGRVAFSVLIEPRSRVVIPAYIFEEMQNKFVWQKDSNREIRIPPTPALRLLSHCQNVRILGRGPAALAWEIKLKRRDSGIPAQDVPVAAAALVVRDYASPVVLITSDGKLATWADSVGIGLIRTGKRE